MENYKQVEWEDVADMKELSGVTPKLTENEWTILNDSIEYKESRRKHASVLYFLKKHIILNEGFFSKSIDNIHAMFKRNKNYISTGQLKNIVNRLKDLELICVKRVKKRNIYALPLAEKLAKKLANKKSTQPVVNSGFENNSKKHRYEILDKDYNTNTTLEKPKKSLMQILREEYRGIKSTGIATKDELRKLAQHVLTIKGFGGNNAMHKSIQYLVFNKIKFSQQKIDRLGAIAYIEKVVEDRINAYNDKEIDTPVPDFITNQVANNSYSYNQPKKLRFCDFPQREYDYDALEKELLEWDDDDEYYETEN